VCPPVPTPLSRASPPTRPAAERALQELNYSKINDKPIRVMWSHRDPNARKNMAANIFIKNLDESIDTKALHDTFEAFGKILSAKVSQSADGKSRGFGFIQFDSPEAAATAIEKVNGMVIENRKVFVGPFQKKQERSAEGASKFTNIFVKNLAPEVDEAGLKEMFSVYGNTTSIAIMKGEDGVSKGFGFVSFEDPEHAAAAVAGHDGKEVNGKPLFVGRAQKKSERDALLREKYEKAREERLQKVSGMNLFIKNLDESIDDARLREEFAPYGTITSAKVMRDDKGATKAFGFVCFSAPEEAIKAVTEANGKMVAGKPLYVALHQRKEIRKAQLEAAYAQRLAMGARAMGPAGMAPPGALGMYGAPMLYNMQGMPPGARGAPMMYGAPPMMAGQRGGPYRGGPLPGPRAGYAPPMPPGAYVLGPNGLPQAPAGARGPAGPRGMGPNGNARMPRQQMMEMNGGMMPGMMPNGMMMGPGGPMAPGTPGKGPGGPMAGPKGGMPAAGPGAMRPGMAAPQAPKGGYAGAAARPAAPPVPAAQPIIPGAGEVLTTATLASASPEQQKQLLGERLFPQVAQLQPELAAKITGMLLEMDNTELLLLLESHDALVAKVDEAIQVLRQHQMVP